MKKEKIPIPVSTLVLMIVTITYKLVLVVIGVTLTIFGQGFIKAHLYRVRHSFLSGDGTQCILCVRNAGTRISSDACKNNSCKRT